MVGCQVPPVVLPTQLGLAASVTICFLSGSYQVSEQGMVAAPNLPLILDLSVLCESEPTSPQENVAMALPSKKFCQASPNCQPNCAFCPVAASFCRNSSAATWPGWLISGSKVSGSNQ